MPQRKATARAYLILTSAFGPVPSDLIARQRQRPGAFPFDTDNNPFADQIVVIEDIISEASGALAWGGHLAVPDQGLIYISSAPSAAVSAEAAQMFEEQDSMDSSTGAGSIDAFQPARRRAAMAFAHSQR